MHENFPAGVIVTGGLGSGYQHIVLAEFHLFHFVFGGGSPPVVEVDVTVSSPIGGGSSFPQQIFKPGEEDELVWTPREDGEREVTIKVRIGERRVERHYFVKPRTETIIMRVYNFVNTTKKRINVGVDKIAQVTKDISVKLRNLGKKR